MSGISIAMVLFAALLHASWNALLKVGSDRAAVLAAVSASHAIAGLLLVSVAPLPARESWPFIAISTAVHYGYYLLLFRAYRHGDLSQVYPISRGLAPAAVAISAWVLIGERLPVAGWFGLFTISAGIGFLAYQRGAAQAKNATILLAVALGLVIAAYSVADGIGVRKSGSALGYMGWLFLCEAPVPLTIALMRHRAGGRFDMVTVAMGLMGGVFAVTAYGLVLYAKTLAPLGAVSALRESSVIIAALIGVVVYRERPWRGRLMAAAIVAGGIAMLASIPG